MFNFLCYSRTSTRRTVRRVSLRASTLNSQRPQTPSSPRPSLSYRARWGRTGPDSFLLSARLPERFNRIWKVVSDNLQASQNSWTEGDHKSPSVPVLLLRRFPACLFVCLFVVCCCSDPVQGAWEEGGLLLTVLAAPWDPGHGPRQGGDPAPQWGQRSPQLHNSYIF